MPLHSQSMLQAHGWLERLNFLSFVTFFLFFLSFFFFFFFSILRCRPADTPDPGNSRRGPQRGKQDTVTQ